MADDLNTTEIQARWHYLCDICTEVHDKEGSRDVDALCDALDEARETLTRLRSERYPAFQVRLDLATERDRYKADLDALRTRIAELPDDEALVEDVARAILAVANKNTTQLYDDEADLAARASLPAVRDYLLGES